MSLDHPHASTRVPNSNSLEVNTAVAKHSSLLKNYGRAALLEVTGEIMGLSFAKREENMAQYSCPDDIYAVP